MAALRGTVSEEGDAALGGDRKAGGVGGDHLPLCCKARFVWPIPDSGLGRRLHRITTPTLVVWGENDRLCPVAYADDFVAGIPNSSKVIIPQCGHIPQVERRLELHAAIAQLLG